MLDIRATHYVSPLSEVDFVSVPLTVHLANVADEAGVVTGKFRIYNDVTGLLIHTSDIAPLTLAAGVAADVSALTDFNPPAIADDLYFVIFDGNASNALVPDGISFALGAFYFDVKAQGMGPAPAAHHLTHEEGGSDEIEVADMATAELDDTLVLQPDGAGGVEWETIPAGVTDHDLLNNLAYADAGHTGFAPTAHDHDEDTLKANGITNDETECLLKQTGDTYGTTSLSIRCRNGAAGALFQSHTLNLVDFGFKPSTGYQSNIRFEARNAQMLCGANNGAGEFQFIDDATNFGNETFFLALGKGACLFNATKHGFGTSSPTALVDVNSDIIRLRTAKTPANAGAAGNAGDICWDADYIYVCVATNTWVRVETQSW